MERISAKKALIYASTPSDEATDDRHSKRTSAHKPDQVGHNFEPGSRVTEASDSQPESLLF
jgi:hypothetical protein